MNDFRMDGTAMITALLPVRCTDLENVFMLGGNISADDGSGLICDSWVQMPHAGQHSYLS